MTETAGGLGASAHSFVKNLARDAYLSGSESIVEGRVEGFVRKVPHYRWAMSSYRWKGRRSRMKYAQAL